MKDHSFHHSVNMVFKFGETKFTSDKVVDVPIKVKVIDNEGKVWVVEVNPFGELAGSCLFSWSKDRDILMGLEPFQFRIVNEPPSLGLIKSELDPRVLDIIGVK